MKNNFITKIIGATLAFAMMIGGAVGINVAKEAKMVHADTGSLEVTASDLGYTNTTYSNKSGIAVGTEGFKFSTTDVCKQSGQVHFQLKKTSGVLWNSACPAGYTITSIELTSKSGGNVTVYKGSSAKPSSTTVTGTNNVYTINDQYFKIANPASAAYFSLTVNYSFVSGPSLSITGNSYLKDGSSTTIVGSIGNNNNYSITWSANNNHVSFDPESSSSDQQVTVSFDGVETGTTPVIITGTLNNNGDAVTNTKKIYALEHSGTQADPFSATDAQVFSHTNYAAQSGGDWYVGGYVVGTYQTNKGYYIDEDNTATTSKKFEVYNSSGIVNNTGRDIIVGTSYIVAHGSMTCYNNTQCETQNSILVSVDNGNIPSINIDGGDRTVDINDNLTLTVTKEYDEGASVSWTSSDEDVATVSNGVVTLKAIGETDITASMTVNAIVYSSTITLTVIENILSNGDTFVIKAVYSEQTYYLSGIDGSYGTTTTDVSNAMILTAVSTANSGQFKLRSGENYLSYTGSSANLSSTTDANSDAIIWTATNDGVNKIIKNINTDRRIQFNYNNGNPRFSCYTNLVEIDIEAIVPPEVDEVTLLGDTMVNAEGAASITKEYLYEVTYVNNAGTGAVTASVVNSHDEEEGASITAGPSEGVLSVTFTANDTYTITVTSSENTAKSESITVTVSNIYVPITTDYISYSGTEVAGQTTLIEGDYLFYYGGKAMKALISSNRAQYEEVTPSGNTISTLDTSIVWHVAPVANGYYTIFNAAANKYLASTGSNNQAKLESDVTDNSRWTVQISQGTFEFINKARSNVDNKYLRNNGTYGFACYASNTGGALSLYKRDALSYLNAFTSDAKLIANETGEGVDSVAIRFTTKVSKYIWDSIAADYGVSEFGIMLFKTRNENHLSAQEKFEAEADPNNPITVVTINNTDFGLTLDDQDTHYSFNVKVNIAGPSSYDLKFCASPYIVVNGTYHFLGNMDPSVNSLAQAGASALESTLSSEALAILAGN